MCIFKSKMATEGFLSVSFRVTLLRTQRRGRERKRTFVIFGLNIVTAFLSALSAALDRG